jgi:SNF2 family DNA or RNA helicase
MDLFLGHPLQNNLLEYWSMVDIVQKNFLDNEDTFKKKYSVAIELGGSEKIFIDL